jgi:Site-specific recombinases, DNA invertase Pin homologs
MDLLNEVRSGDSIVVVRLDRLARSVSQLIAIVQQIEAHGVTLISLGDNIDTSSASGRLTFHIFAALAEFERNLIIERTKAGLDAARAAGRTGGRPPALKPSQVEEARKWIADRTMSQQQAARALGVARSTLARALR